MTFVAALSYTSLQNYTERGGKSMNNSAFLSSLLFSAFSFGAPHSYYIIIHGTWSRPFSWHMPGGDFYDALASVSQPGTVSFFLWSGENSHEARIAGGKKLVRYIQQFYPHDAEINIVSHSHGSNVGILASQEFAKDPYNKHRIHNFYALGTPTNTTQYMPDMNAISYFYNLFSYNDYVQPVFGFFEREYPKHDRIANICITINKKEPRHSEMHAALIAQWIPSIHEDLASQAIAGFDQFTFKKPGIIHFNDGDTPTYELDEERRYKKEHNERLAQAFNNVHMELRKKTQSS